MKAVAVGRLYNYIVRLLRLTRIFYKRTVQVAEIPRKNNFFGLPMFFRGDRYACRAEQMTRVGKFYRYAVAYPVLGIIPAGDKLLHSLFNVLRSIKRNIGSRAGPLCLTVAPAGLKFLNMRRVEQHYFAQPCGCRRGIYMSLKPAGAQGRYFSRMVYMRMGKKQKIHLRRQHRQVGVFVNIAPLLHSAVYHYGFSACLKQRAGTGDLVRGAAESYFHTVTTFLF